MNRPLQTLATLFLTAVPSAAPLLAQDEAVAPAADEGYRLPPAEVVEIVDAAPSPDVIFSPTYSYYVLGERSPMPSIADLSRRMLRLAGMRIDPGANAPFRTSFIEGMQLYRMLSAADKRIPIPEGGRVGTVSFSFNKRFFVFTVHFDDHSELWGGANDQPTEPRLLTDRLSTVTGGITWMSDGARVLCRLVPEDRGPEPAAPTVPRGPNIRTTKGSKSPLRTYQDLLSSAYEEDLFEYYATTELAILGVSHDRLEVVEPEPAIYAGASNSPDGRYLLVTTVQRPFSFLMPWRSFPRTIRVVELEGERSQHVVARIPLGENIPLHGVRTGPRQVDWKAGEGATVVWVEALDGGDPKREVAARDRWMVQAIPAAEPPRELLRTEHRARGLTWFEDKHLVLAGEYDRDRRWTRSWFYDMSASEVEPKLLEDRSVRDRYGDPGRVATMPDWQGNRIARLDGPWIYRSGRGATPEGLFPFIDRQNVITGESERLWTCPADLYESVITIKDTVEDSLPAIVTRRESSTKPPNYFFRQLHAQKEYQMTNFDDPTPQIRDITKQLVTYERNDGVQLSATLYLPADYEEGTRLPLIVWAYPIEFNDAKTAGQVATSTNRYTRISGYSHLNLLTQGYAIMDGATMPIIGDAETMNDTFIEQLVASAQAAIDKAVAMGVADPERVAVGGHSYGAFMTANLLAHCDLFKAGIARSGAYNRTLTPFGFQAERRTFWEAPEVYFGISPFMHADKINEPLLMIHGEADNNSGTFPIQSERLFQAIKGNGGTARLVMLPNESHGYRSRESVLHVLAETIDWLDEYVKNAGSQ